MQLTSSAAEAKQLRGIGSNILSAIIAALIITYK